MAPVVLLANTFCSIRIDEQRAASLIVATKEELFNIACSVAPADGTGVNNVP